MESMNDWAYYCLFTFIYLFISDITRVKRTSVSSKYYIRDQIQHAVEHRDDTEHFKSISKLKLDSLLRLHSYTVYNLVLKPLLLFKIILYHLKHQTYHSQWRTRHLPENKTSSIISRTLTWTNNCIYCTLQL